MRVGLGKMHTIRVINSYTSPAPAVEGRTRRGRRATRHARSGSKEATLLASMSLVVCLVGFVDSRPNSWRHAAVEGGMRVLVFFQDAAFFVKGFFKTRPQRTESPRHRHSGHSTHSDGTRSGCVYTGCVALSFRLLRAVLRLRITSALRAHGPCERVGRGVCSLSRAAEPLHRGRHITVPAPPAPA